jgi:hypothetical protein
MTQLEATAYCNDLALRAWPEPIPTGDPFLDQIAVGYANLQRGRAFTQCMTDNGY